MIRATGIDISYYDLSFDSAIASRKIDFVIQRVSLGLRSGKIIKDTALETLYQGARKIGIVGAYHYLSSHSGWKSQADFFLSIVQDLDYQFYALDFEGAYNTMGDDFAAAAQNWTTYVALKSKKKVVLYTNPSHYDADLYPYGDWMQLYPLWIAQYWKDPSPDRTPALPKKRKKGDWSIWQYASEINFPGHGKEYGCGGNSVDLNVFNGTVEDMHAWLQFYTPPPPPPPNTDKKYKVVVGHLNIRVAPNVNASITGGMKQGDVFGVVEKVKAGEYTWLKMTDGCYVCEKSEYFFAEEVS